jgi:glycosyltransferase involved in cell wall biosynthesis
MRIALLAPPYLPVPPKAYGGTEKIVSLLCEGLVARGHDVTLFASGDSITKAKLSSTYPVAVGNSGLNKSDALVPLRQYEDCYRRATEFDIIHSHGQYLSLFGARGVSTPVVFTWHGSFYPGEVPEEKRQTLSMFATYPYISISNNQRRGLPDLRYVATVYNALDIAEYPFIERPKGDFLLWVGRMSPKKGALEAIHVAKKTGIRLEMAGALDPIDMPYFKEVIRPLIDGVDIVFHGELNHKTLMYLYGNALALLNPISWHEPFGLVMIESMACGTPVIAFDIGSVPEVVEDGLTGFVVTQQAGEDAMTKAVGKLSGISRSTCRRMVEKRFHKDRMVEEYEQVYRTITGVK